MPLSSPTTPTKRKRWLKRSFVAMTAGSLAIAIAVSVAPLESRWLVANGLEQFYEVVDGSEPNHFGPQRVPGLADEAVRGRLDELTGQHWQIENHTASHLLKDPTDFAHEDPTRSQVATFREQTAELWVEPIDVFEVARRVRHLTRHETDFDSNDVVECLNAARSGRGLLCQHFSRLFACVCSARGYTTRVVSLSSNGEYFDHAMCEIYLPEQRKWVLIDTDFGVAYRRNDEWLNAVEVQAGWKQLRDGKFEPNGSTAAQKQTTVLKETGIELVVFGNSEPNLRDKRMAESPTGMNLELFEYLFLAMRDDNIGMQYPPGHPTKVKQLCFRADGTDEFVEVCPEAEFRDQANAYWHVGASEIQFLSVQQETDTDQPELQLQFSTRTPRFKEFEIRINGQTWQSCEPNLTWPLSNDKNQIDLRSINSSGVRGPISTIHIEPK